jgi:hypothetical protein|tara:strand:- start:6367 stop:6714 length:348 start_codon:yes stop_codon:yes gene_type:complete
MLVYCDSKCKTTVNASLDVSSNEAICNQCGEEIVNVSQYLKISMKTNGDILRRNKKKAFVFYCESHDNHVETTYINSVLVGKSCPRDSSPCRINITNHMKRAIEETSKSKIEEEG